MADRVAGAEAVMAGRVTLVAGGQRFVADRAVLAAGSAYFCAMFSGSYREAEEPEIHMQMITAQAMKDILYYLINKKIDMIQLDYVVDLLNAANYLDLTDLYNEIVDKLASLIDCKTCFKILYIARLFELVDLEAKVKSYALFSFSEVKDSIIDIEDNKTLFWYLCHQHLNVSDEMDVFKAGCVWLQHHRDNPNDILILLTSLIFRNLKISAIEEMLTNELVKDNEMSLKVVKGVLKSLRNNCFKNDEIRDVLKNEDEETIDIVINLLSVSKTRTAALQPCVLKRTLGKFEVMTLDNKNNLVSCLSIPGVWWGNSVVSWKGFILIVMCGKVKDRDVWNRCIEMFNFLDGKWTVFASKCNIYRRHATAIVNENLIYLIGGFGQYRIQLNSVQTYNITSGAWTSLPDLPEINNCIVATFHQGKLFVAGDYLYVYTNDAWQNLLKLPDTYSAIISYNERLYFTEKWKNRLLFWQDQNFFIQRLSSPELVKHCHYNVIGICNIANIAYIFSEGDDMDYSMSVESYSLAEDRAENNLNTDLLWLDKEPNGNFYSIASCFTLAKTNVEDNYLNIFGMRWLTPSSPN